MEFAGLVRTYRLHIPPSYDGRKLVPLVLAFHGRLGTGRAQERLSKLSTVSDQNNFIVVYPDGIYRSWNAGHRVGGAERLNIDDVGFVSQLINELMQILRIDPYRVYATGMSNGGIFVHRLGCELSDKIAAIASVAGPIAPSVLESCNSNDPVSVLEIHGTNDPIVPWNGGETKGKGYVESVEKTIEFWVKHNRCTGTSKTKRISGNVIKQSYTPCQSGTEVVLYKIEAGGHTWPEGNEYFPEAVVGQTNNEFNASQAIWDFFKRHPMKRR
jgi:polyhydroxybutyrate depolymerase